MKKVLLIFLASMMSWSLVIAQDGEGAYVIGPEDVLEITFWQDPDLDAAVKVRQDGMISLDIIGEIRAAGKTTSELERTIVKQMSRYNKAISQAIVRVVEYGYNKVYISGAVLNPGKYTFEEIPNLFTIINEAGGITEFGDLSRVLIIRGGPDDSGQVEVVNVAEAIAEGRLNDLPKIRPGDAIEVSRAPAGLPARSLSVQPRAKNIFYVMGEVTTPGALTYEENLDLLDAIALAGGTTELADLEKVRVVSKQGRHAQVLRVDLDKYSKTGAPARYLIQPEDNIIVGRRSRGFLGISSFADVVTILGALSTGVFIYTTLDGE